MRPYLPAQVRFVTPVFGEMVEGRIMEKGVYVKMARGEMVRWLAEQGAETPEGLPAFTGLGYRYVRELSGRDMPVFLKG